MRIVGGNERCPSEEEHAEIEMKKNARNLERPRIAKKAILTIVVLTCINLLNYMDRFTVAGKRFKSFTNKLSRKTLKVMPVKRRRRRKSREKH